MPQLSRVIGTVSENLRVFINDATVSTGAGLANIVASSVNFSWSRNDMSTISSGTCTTGSLGTYTVSSFVQVSSTSSLGWYEFDPPNGAFVSGDCVLIHLYGAPNMAPLPILIELTKTNNQAFMSTQTISTALNSLAAVVTTNNDKTGYTTLDWTSTLPESYRSVNGLGTPTQILYELLANITDMGNSATTRTLNSVTSHLPGTITYGYDVSISSGPSSITRTA